MSFYEFIIAKMVAMGAKPWPIGQGQPSNRTFRKGQKRNRKLGFRNR